MIIQRLILIFIIIAFFSACKTKEEEEEAPSYQQEGIASYYADFFQGKTTASGELFFQDSLTAAHMYLPLGTEVKVINLENDSSVTVTINDRGPYVSGRIIDLSKVAAQQLKMIDQGTTTVRVKVTKPADGYTLLDSVAIDRIGK